MTATIHQADVLDWLAAYDGPRFHSCFADPPYALISIAERFGSEDATPAQHGTDGVFQRGATPEEVPYSGTTGLAGSGTP